YLHFDLDPDSPYPIDKPVWQAIVEWVEGADIVCSFDHMFDEEEIRGIVEDQSVSGVLSSYPDMLDYVHRIRPELKLFQQVESWEEVDRKLTLTGVIGPDKSASPSTYFLLCNGPLEAELAVKNGAKR